VEEEALPNPGPLAARRNDSFEQKEKKKTEPRLKGGPRDFLPG
jgi:hypothetical protein